MQPVATFNMPEMDFSSLDAPRDPTSRDDRLKAHFARLGPDRLDALDDVWDLCAQDLHGLALWRTGSSQDAEDALQDVFIRLAKAAQQDKLSHVEKPFAYLLRIAHSAAIDVLRQRSRHQSQDLDDEVAHGKIPFVDAGHEQAAEASRLARHVAKLPEKQRAVVYLRHFVELSFRDIGKVIGIPTFTAASRYRLGLRRLRKLMGVTP